MARATSPLPLRAGCWATVFVGLFLTGCGLDEYERKMQIEQKRADYFDEEDRILDDPLESPKKKEGDKSPTVDLFLRLPKGFRRTCDDNPLGLVLYRYPKGMGGAAAAFNPAGTAGNAPSAIQEIYVGTAKDSKDFWTEVVKPFPGINVSKPLKYEKRTIGRLPLYFDTLVYADTSSAYFFYLYRQEGYQVAIVFRVERQKANDTEKEREMILGTLYVGPEAAEQRRLYQPRLTAKTSPAPTGPRRGR